MIVLFLAWYLQTRIHTIDNFKETILPAVIPPLVFIALILKEPDLGTALGGAGVMMLMLFLAGLPVRWLLLGGAAASPVLYFMLFHVAWRAKRMFVFMHPEADPRGAGFHIMQSLIAVGTGGFRGLGLMEGRQKLFYLPEPHTDFFFGNISEELGLFGGFGVLAGVARGVYVVGPVCAVSGVWVDDDHPGAGVLQYECGVGAAADQGAATAVYLVGWDECVCDAGLHWGAFECHQRKL